MAALDPKEIKALVAWHNPLAQKCASATMDELDAAIDQLRTVLERDEARLAADQANRPSYAPGPMRREIEGAALVKQGREALKLARAIRTIRKVENQESRERWLAAIGL